MSHRDSDAAYRVRTVQTNHRKDDRVSVTLSRPYATLAAARGQATREKHAWRNVTWVDTVVTVERATGWETV